MKHIKLVQRAARNILLQNPPQSLRDVRCGRPPASHALPSQRPMLATAPRHAYSVKETNQRFARPVKRPATLTPKSGKTAPSPRPARDMPSRDEIRRFIQAATGRVGKREIARAFKLGPEHQVALKGILKSLAHEGQVAPAGHKRFTPPDRLPETVAVVITGTDPDGDPIGRPVSWTGDGKPPLILMHPEPAGRPALAPGDRILARLKPIGSGKYEGRTFKRLAATPSKVLGIFRAPDRLTPTDRRAKAEWRIPPGEAAGALSGDIVLAEPLPGTGYGLKTARVTERLGKMGDARSVSLICIHTHDIPQEFSPEALAEAKKARGVPLGKRTDLRDLPLITIDGEDARDFDDAVYAEPDGDGFRLIVAIADVAHYVRPDSALDRAARQRGNSCYFPDRVVPMLPEDLSNGWCSLRPDEERGCMFVDMHIDASGKKTRHAFGRGLMKSAARLTYTQVQDAADAGDKLHLPPGSLDTLYAAFRALLAARNRRGTLDLDLPERKVVLDDQGRVADIAPRPRLDSHKLIEEFMVLANVAAAEELERLKKPCMYRVHAPPSDEKLFNLRSFLSTLDISLPAGNALHPRDLDAVLKKVAGTDQALVVNEVMLRSQSQAAYHPDNIGHFGLSLARYGHFTSPIRRYADLLVHRALIGGLKLGLGALTPEEAASFEETADHITSTERRAAIAEREAVDRYLSAYMADKVGARFTARISGVTRFGLFVTLQGSGANGLIPLSSLPDDYWMHDEATQTLNGRRTRQSFRLTQEVTVRLKEASPVTGGLIFDLCTGGAGSVGGVGGVGGERGTGHTGNKAGEFGIERAGNKAGAAARGRQGGGKKRRPR
jgi:ribonuclease R